MSSTAGGPVVVCVPDGNGALAVDYDQSSGGEDNDAANDDLDILADATAPFPPDVTIRGLGADPSALVVTNDLTEQVRLFDVGDGSSLCLQNLTLVGRTLSSPDGGVIRVGPGGTLLLEQVVIENAHALGRGGAIFADTGAFVDATSVSIPSPRANQGGAIWAGGANVFLDGVDIDGAVAVRDGGSVYVEDASLLVRASQFTGSSADFGGAVWMQDSTMTLHSSSIIAAQASDDGGGIWASDSTLTVQSSDIDSGVAEGFGGGVFAQRTDVALAGANVTGNAAGAWGGAVYAGIGDFTAIASTVDATRPSAAAASTTRVVPGISSCSRTRCLPKTWRCFRRAAGCLPKGPGWSDSRASKLGGIRPA